MINWQNYIESNKTILLGKPVIKGTRLSVEHIVGLLAQGWTEQQLIENYPRLTPEGIRAIFLYLEDCIRDGLLFLPDGKKAS